MDKHSSFAIRIERTVCGWLRQEQRPQLQFDSDQVLEKVSIMSNLNADVAFYLFVAILGAVMVASIILCIVGAVCLKVEEELDYSTSESSSGSKKKDTEKKKKEKKEKSKAKPKEAPKEAPKSETPPANQAKPETPPANEAKQDEAA